MDKTPVNAHQDEPRTLGGRLPRIVADVLSHDRAFLDALAQQGPRSIEGTVTATQRDSGGANRVQITRTGQAASEAAWYTVWNPMHVPIVGDVLRLLVVGKGAAIILGAKAGGRPNEQTIAYAGGAHHLYDAARNHIHKHGDDHHHRHYGTGGSSIVAHHSAGGQHGHVGPHVHNAASLADDGTPTGPYVGHTQNAASAHRYERSQHQGTADGTVLAHYHDLYSGMAHFFDDGTGTSTRHSHLHTYQGHTHPKGHIMGDDGAGATRGKLYMQHGGGNRALDHDGTQHRAWAYSGATAGQHVHSYSAHTHPKGHVVGDDGAGTATGKLYLAHGSGYRCYDSDGVVLQHYSAGQVAHTTDGHTHTFYDLSQSSTAAVVHMSSRQTQEGAGGSGGHVAVKQSGTTSYHTITDENGHLRQTSIGANHYVDVNGGGTTARHTHTPESTTRPSGAYHSHPSSDGSVLHHLTPSGGGALKRATHATTPQVVGTGSAVISGNNIHIAAYAFPGGAPGDPHLKLMSGTVWDSGAISNPGFYSHNPAAIISNTGSAYSNYVYNTAGGGQNTSYAWGTSNIAHTSAVDLHATKIGSPANLAVGTALWTHIVS